MMPHFDDLLPDPRNPRTITPEAADGLRTSLDVFGDLAGITWNERTGQLVAGHQRMDAIRALAETRGVSPRVDGGMIVLPAGGGQPEERFALRVVDWEPIRQTAANIAANNPAIAGAFTDGLADLLKDVEAGLPDIFDDACFGALLKEAEQLERDARNGEAEPPEPKIDRAAELARDWGTALGQVWEVPSLTVPGRCHRVVCGDSTERADVARLMGGIKGIDLLHADPPYGMGKEAEGVANDNLYREKLDAFQMAWWRTWRPFLADNASAYIWGNAPELWRLWYVGGLGTSERMTIRNEITWDKREDNPTMLVSGVPFEARRMYHPTERCLFFMLGEQGFNNNADNYWEGWEPVRSLLEADCKAMGWGPADIQRICGVGMYGHWFTRSQWAFIPEEHYKKLQAAARDHDAFKRDHDAFKRDHDDLKRAFYATRAYFDNTHDNMTDVWEFPRVVGEDRHGHATPKPVALVARAIKSSCPPGGIVAEPFLGSGTTLIAAEREGRICVGCELSPGYVAVILQRCKDAGLDPKRSS